MRRPTRGEGGTEKVKRQMSVGPGGVEGAEEEVVVVEAFGGLSSTVLMRN